MSEPDPYTFYCDVYSFGVVLYELITAQLPYAHMQERDLVRFKTVLCFLVYNRIQNKVFHFIGTAVTLLKRGGKRYAVW